MLYLPCSVSVLGFPANGCVRLAQCPMHNEAARMITLDALREFEVPDAYKKHLVITEMNSSECFPLFLTISLAPNCD